MSNLLTTTPSHRRIILTRTRVRSVRGTELYSTRAASSFRWRAIVCASGEKGAKSCATNQKVAPIHPEQPISTEYKSTNAPNPCPILIDFKQWSLLPQRLIVAQQSNTFKKIFKTSLFLPSNPQRLILLNLQTTRVSKPHIR